MRKKNQPKKSYRENVRRESDPLPWKYCFATLACGVVIVGGLFWAAKTHFASINYCIRNADLKKQLSELEAEKRRLIFAKEIALAPAEIKKAARKLGLVEMTALNIQSTEDPGSRTVSESNPLVLKTVDARPVERTKQANAAGMGETRERRVDKTSKESVASIDARERKLSKTGK